MSPSERFDEPEIDAEARRQYQREYYLKNRERRLANAKAYYAKNRERCLLYLRAYSRKRYLEHKLRELK